MRAGQRVRIRPSSPLAGQYRLDPGAQGVVLCQYEVLARGPAAAMRVDVRLIGGRTVWGAPVDAFEAIEDGRKIVNAN